MKGFKEEFPGFYDVLCINKDLKNSSFSLVFITVKCLSHIGIVVFSF